MRLIREVREVLLPAPKPEKAPLPEVPLPPTHTLKTSEITKQMWDVAPAGDKKKFKDGTRLLLFRDLTKQTGTWHKVFWKS
jgi:hypothetical protein